MMIDDISTVLIRFFGFLSFLSYLRVAAEAVAEWKANTTVLRIQAWFQLPLACLSLVYLFTYTRDDVFVKIKGFSFNLPALNACFFFDLGLSLVYLLMLDCQWPRERSQRFVRYLHGIVWSLAMLPAVYLLANRLYSPGKGVCWISKDASTTALVFRESVHAISLVQIVFSWYIM